MKDKATIKKLKNEDVLIYKSDKTNRLVALNSSSYKERLQEAIGETKGTKQIKSVTLQSKFNKALRDIASPYPGRILKLLENSRSFVKTIIWLPKRS